ncbi:hypothetical protein [Malonomonas rubra]|nr:hypothetical protein [Malonomonas rubra]
MKLLSYLVLIVLLNLLVACASFRSENPLNLKCPDCGYIWDRTPTQGN